MTDRTRLRTATAGTLIAILAVLVLAVDQFTKYLALQNLPYQETVDVWGEFLQFFLTRNAGAAFSLGEDVTWIFTIVLGAAAVLIVVIGVWKVHSRLWTVVLGLLLGGILGNLTDRLTRDPGFGVGHVVDFIYTPWMMPAIYNVADIFIVTMMISVALLIFLGVRLDGTRLPRTSDEKADLEAAGEDAADVSGEADASVEADAEAPSDLPERDR